MLSYFCDCYFFGFDGIDTDRPWHILSHSKKVDKPGQPNWSKL